MQSEASAKKMNESAAENLDAIKASQTPESAAAAENLDAAIKGSKTHNNS